MAKKEKPSESSDEITEVTQNIFSSVLGVNVQNGRSRGGCCGGGCNRMSANQLVDILDDVEKQQQPKKS
jgi:hypothetical protein